MQICKSMEVNPPSKLLANCGSRANRTRVSLCNIHIYQDADVVFCAVIDGDIAYWKSGA